MVKDEGLSAPSGAVALACRRAFVMKARDWLSPVHASQREPPFPKEKIRFDAQTDIH
jgi:hypothetical protein